MRKDIIRKRKLDNMPGRKYIVQAWLTTKDGQERKLSTSIVGRAEAIATAQRLMIKIVADYNVGTIDKGYDMDKILDIRDMGFRVKYAHNQNLTYFQVFYDYSEIKRWILSKDINR